MMWYSAEASGNVYFMLKHVCLECKPTMFEYAYYSQVNFCQCKRYNCLLVATSIFMKPSPLFTVLTTFALISRGKKTRHVDYIPPHYYYAHLSCNKPYRKDCAAFLFTKFTISLPVEKW